MNIPTDDHELNLVVRLIEVHGLVNVLKLVQNAVDCKANPLNDAGEEADPNDEGMLCYRAVDDLEGLINKTSKRIRIRIQLRT